MVTNAWPLGWASSRRRPSVPRRPSARSRADACRGWPAPPGRVPEAGRSVKRSGARELACARSFGPQSAEHLGALGRGQRIPPGPTCQWLGRRRARVRVQQRLYPLAQRGRALKVAQYTQGDEVGHIQRAPNKPRAALPCEHARQRCAQIGEAGLIFKTVHPGSESVEHPVGHVKSSFPMTENRASQEPKSTTFRRVMIAATVAPWVGGSGADETAAHTAASATARFSGWPRIPKCSSLGSATGHRCITVFLEKLGLPEEKEAASWIINAHWPCLTSMER